MKNLLNLTLVSCCHKRFQWFSRHDEPMPIIYVDAGYEAAADFYIQAKDCGSEAKNSYTSDGVETVRVMLEFSIASCKLLTISSKIQGWGRRDCVHIRRQSYYCTWVCIRRVLQRHGSPAEIIVVAETDTNEIVMNPRECCRSTYRCGVSGLDDGPVAYLYRFFERTSSYYERIIQQKHFTSRYLMHRGIRFIDSGPAPVHMYVCTRRICIRNLYNLGPLQIVSYRVRLQD